VLISGMAVLHCPICGKVFESGQSPAMPFCSPRCRQMDLGRWLSEAYSLDELTDLDPADVPQPPQSQPSQPDDDLEESP
jgi:uncharacterized protein